MDMSLSVPVQEEGRERHETSIPFTDRRRRKEKKKGNRMGFSAPKELRRGGGNSILSFISVGEGGGRNLRFPPPASGAGERKGKKALETMMLHFCPQGGEEKGMFLRGKRGKSYQLLFA